MVSVEERYEFYEVKTMKVKAISNLSEFLFIACEHPFSGSLDMDKFSDALFWLKFK